MTVKRNIIRMMVIIFVNSMIFIAFEHMAYPKNSHVFKYMRLYGYNKQ